MYKFRSMYMDAEERKAELMAQNKMSDGRMFKLDFDPRVIGNKILPDGRKKTGVGEFIRKTSLDEFPQFWNVLKGDMSLVGTRPILQDELEQYELHHRARIATKPGITGMWQVSGRSNITDFEEVLTKHFLDSLSCVKTIDMTKVKTMIDIGTGAGFPGVPLKIAFPHLQACLLDSLKKRVNFLEESFQLLGLTDIKAIHGRAEEYARNKEYREQYDLCVSRAVSNLATIV